ncbi:MAG: cysteine desulfurase [Actinomycetota bacterium]|nr:cysteine desulfurase [Actinomycetota bacterium]
MSNTTVYLDNAATTPLDERVLETMLPLLKAGFGNPSSLHAFGVAASEVVEEARVSVAEFLGASPAEIYFTSGGTESDALAMFGLAKSNNENRHIVISSVEHAAVHEAASRLESEGYEVSRVPVDEHALVDLAEFESALRPDTAIAAVVWANNEVGTVQPIAELSSICAERGIPFHSDAVQAAGRSSLNVEEVPVSTLALSSHKLYGPQGVGALYVRGGVRISPLQVGGGQESGLRSGTQNVAGIAGFGAAARLAGEEIDERSRYETELRDLLIEEATGIAGVSLNGHPEKRLSNNAHFSVEGVEAEGIVLLCDAMGYAIGSGSACSSGGHKASRVLLAMGQDDREAFSAVRVTVGKGNTRSEVEGFLEVFARVVEQLRKLSPLQSK